METILIFQGGGSLGAYECGAYQSLAPWLRSKGHHVCVVAGTSIGAINASIIAARYGSVDQGAEALHDFWRSLAAQPFKFPVLTGENPSWNAVWTSLLFGNSRLFRPTVPFWTFTPPVTWAPFTNFYDTGPMEKTLAGFFHAIGPRQEDPRLIVTAVDLQKIKAVAFDSWQIAVTPRHVVASCSLPPSFPVTQIDNDSYWDGGLWSNTPLVEVLNCLREPGSPGPEPMTDCLVFIVDVFAPGGSSPTVIRGNWDIWALRDRVLFQDKTSYDQRSAIWANKYIKLLRHLHGRLQSLPPDERRLITEQYKQLCDEKRLCLDVYRIARSDRESDAVSREIDFSPERINSLIGRGRTDTSRILVDIDQHVIDEGSPRPRPGL